MTTPTAPAAMSAYSKDAITGQALRKFETHAEPDAAGAQVMR